MSLASKYNTELLAPAGSMESFFAAMEAGADAVYCGLKDFSARSKARNFTLQEMESLSGYAHSLGRKLYVPLNTLIKDAELPHLLDVLTGLAHCQIHGLIIQDLGVYNLVHRYFPELPLHASTQMAVHNSGGVQMLERMGFERAVLARELSLAEIKHIRANTGIELEHFVHGALCYSISGHCLFSSFQTGKSGNRGACVQPCRRRYTQNGTDSFAFSTADFGALAHLPQLAQNGVMSFKIEGRMKNSEYVWNVVRAYREVLDCAETDMQAAIRRGNTILEQSHGRQCTSGFLTGKSSTILRPHQKGGIGKTAGEVERIAGRYLSFKSQTPLHIGDKLRIQPKTDQPGTAFTLREIQVDRKPVKHTQPGQYITVTSPFHNRFAKGDNIFKISTGRGFTLSEEACRRRLLNVTPPATQISLTIACTPTTFTVTASSPVAWQQTYDIETFPAQKSPLSVATLENIFTKTGHPDLQLEHITGRNLPPVVIKPSRLKAIRRDFYGELNRQLQTRLKGQDQDRFEIIKGKLLADITPQTQNPPEILVITDLVHHDLQDNPTLTLILPLVAEPTRHPRDREPVWDIPPIIYDSNWPETRQQIHQKIALGYKRFRLNNISHFTLFSAADRLQLMAGPALYCLNRQAVEALTTQGIQHITSSSEDDKGNITCLSRYSNSLIVPVYGFIPLMTSRIPLSAEDTITTQAGEELHPIQDKGLTQIQSAVPFSLSGRLHELRDLGIAGYLIDLRGHTREQRRTVLQTIKQDQPIIHSTTFNYDRGLT
ncbi:MAG: U32 family peptidase [Desulfobulbaceae bacterium]|jgi:putative protease|nr:U32 family peptidase [Desulfobulbaceae bacterium]